MSIFTDLKPLPIKTKTMFQKFIGVFLVFLTIIFIGYAFSSDAGVSKDVAQIKLSASHILDLEFKMPNNPSEALDALERNLIALEEAQDYIYQAASKLNQEMDILVGIESLNAYNSDSVDQANENMDNLMTDVEQSWGDSNEKYN